MKPNQDGEGGREPKARMPEAVISDEMIADMQQKVGLELRIDHSVFNEEATRIAILKFVGGVGDPNPLWQDVEYAEASVYGGLVAPPSFVMGCFSGLQFGWPGLGAFHSESTICYRRPIRLGDVIRPTCTYQGFDGPKPSRFADRMVVDRFYNEYHNQHGEAVADIHWNVINYERARARKKSEEGDRAQRGTKGEGKAASTPTLPHPWLPEELEEIEAAIVAESPRGSQPRYYEDVEVGDSLDEIIKGPIGMTDEVAFVAGGGAPIPRLSAHRFALLEYRKHPAWAFRDPETSALEPIYSVHYNRHAAIAMGVPMQYDVGFQRQCWHTQLLTDWMGNSGWIKRASAQDRGFVHHGDVIRLTGEVMRRFVDNEGEPCIEVSTRAQNQRGDDVMPGDAIIALPSRTREATPVSIRL